MARAVDSRTRSWLVKIEIAAMLLFDAALVMLALLSWIAFAKVAIETGMATGVPGSPFPPDHVLSDDERLIARGFTPVGYLLWATAVALPAGLLLGIAAVLHRLVVRPLADS
ncbi:MAG: hypothetical protein MPN21_20435 [Thermoanaerobaculia bacterium]|nr:hypothetical protein [Thermoanaerobaculia bacterium]